MKEGVKNKNKHKNEYLLIILLVTVVAVAFIFGGNIFEIFNAGNNDNASDVEKRLERIISDVKGAGKSKVLISYSEKSRVEVAKDVVKTEIGDTVTVKETIVMVGGKPYVINEYSPTVEGVIIVCEGADDLKVRIEITDAVVTALNVSADKIKILKMK